MSAVDVAKRAQEAQPGARLAEMLAKLGRHEMWWRDHQQWLAEKGYMLRTRFRPGWKPSWEGTDKWPTNCDDGLTMQRRHILDATRISDGTIVTLKRIKTADHPHEVEITNFFSSEPIVSHPRNHCVPIYEVLDVPGDEGWHIMVLPLLRQLGRPSFQTVGETVDFFTQVFEGLQFMHQCHIAHRDCMHLNIMMDPVPMFPKLFHPASPLSSMDLETLAKHHTRTWRPTRYYIIDFGLSRKYNPADGPPRELPIWGGDKTVPEFHRDYDKTWDPFPTDIYYIGNMIREEFLMKYEGGLDFIVPLVQDMVQDDPSKRPTMDEVVTRFEKIRQSLSWWKLHSRLVEKEDSDPFTNWKGTRHVFRTVRYILTMRPAIPTPSVPRGKPGAASSSARTASKRYHIR